MAQSVFESMDLRELILQKRKVLMTREKELRENVREFYNKSILAEMEHVFFRDPTGDAGSICPSEYIKERNELIRFYQYQQLHKRAHECDGRVDYSIHLYIWHHDNPWVTHYGITLQRLSTISIDETDCTDDLYASDLLNEPIRWSKVPVRYPDIFEWEQSADESHQNSVN